MAHGIYMGTLFIYLPQGSREQKGYFSLQFHDWQYLKKDFPNGEEVF